MNCLRCGRETVGTQSFCKECTKTVSKPLEESPYLNTQILLPTKRTVSPKAAQTKPAKKQEAKAEKQERTSRRVSVFLGVLCVLAVGMLLVLALFYLELSEAYSDLKDQQTVLESGQAALEEEASLLQERLDLIGEVIVIADSTAPRYYHTCDCPNADTEHCAVMRLQTAILRNYLPCPVCQPPAEYEE